MTHAMVSRSLVIERLLPHAPEKVWRALTDGPLLERWLMNNDFQPVVGHRFTLRAAPGAFWNAVVVGQVLEVVPPARLLYTWQGEGAAGDLHTTVLWTLTPTSGGVLLRMEQSGFRPQQEANYRGALHGWPQFIGTLEGVLSQLS